MTEHRSPEAAEAAAEYEADLAANRAMREASVEQAKAAAVGVFQASEVERGKAAVLSVLAFALGTAVVFGIVVGITAYLRWVF